MTEEHSIRTQIQLIPNGLTVYRLRLSLHFARHRPQPQVECLVLQQGTIEHQLSKPPSRYLFPSLPRKKVIKLATAIGNHIKEQHGTVPSDIYRDFKILRKCQSKFDCLIYEMLFIKELKPTLNKQSDSIRAKLFV